MRARWKELSDAGKIPRGFSGYDYTKDPCRRCGRYPLSVLNRSGYCRKCSRFHIGHKKNRLRIGR